MGRGLRCRPWRASARLRPPPCHTPFFLASFLPLLNRFDYIKWISIKSRKFLTKQPSPGGGWKGTRMNERNLSAEVVREVKKAIVGKDSVLVKVLAAILARGHILLEDIPGVGKTTLALAFAKALDLRFSRMQFTPDVMPSDITGFTLYNKATGQMEYQPGAVMCNLFLADELNRATSRTQSALLEAMEEGQVTVDGVSHPVPQPFVVIATQNPVGASGTQRLPDSQLDRFLLRLSLGYPSPAEELELLRRRQYGQSMGGVSQVVDSQSLEQLRQAAERTYVSDEVLRYIISLVGATRKHPQLIQGASPRATLSLTAVSRAVAFLRGRDYVVPEDVQTIWREAVAHRLLLAPGVEGTADAWGIAGEVLRTVTPPKIQ